jgi:homoserine dehydrogenase
LIPPIRKIVAPLAVIAAVGAAGSYAWRSLRGGETTSGLVSGNGRIEATEVDVATKLAGRVEEILVAEGDFVGRVMLQGRGAGAGPTASAVVADLIDIARGRLTPMWGVAPQALADIPSLPIEAHVGAYYLRLMVVDRPGVIADITAVLRDLGISLESMLQRGRSPKEAVPVVLMTHETAEAAMRAALSRIAAFDSVLEAPTLIRIEAV